MPGEGVPGDGGGIDSGDRDDSGSADAGVLPYQGYVQVQSLNPMFYGAETNFFATQAGGTLCPGGRTFGTCCLFLYADAGSWVGVSGGTVTVTNSQAGQSLTERWDSASSEYGISGFLTWMPGDLVRASSTGGVVDAFSAEVAAPSPIEGLPWDGGALPISTSSPWVLQWTPSDATFMDVLVTGQFGYGVCRTKDGAGSLAFPAELLLALGGDGGMGVATADRSNVAQATCANASVEFRITAEATTVVTFAP